MNYEETKELQVMIEIKNKAEEIYYAFINNTTLEVSKYKDGKFILWSDAHNKAYVKIDRDNNLHYICDFLHEDYSVKISKESIFSGIKNSYRGISHLASHCKVKYNEHYFRQLLKGLEE